jgi:hypothetical protein
MIFFVKIYHNYVYGNIHVKELNLELIKHKFNIYDYLNRPINGRVAGLADFNQE